MAKLMISPRSITFLTADSHFKQGINLYVSVGIPLDKWVGGKLRGEQNRPWILSSSPYSVHGVSEWGRGGIGLVGRIF